MKLELLLVAAYLILVVGIVAIAIPNPVQAVAKHQWCYTSAATGAVCGFDSKVECKLSADNAGPSVSYCGKAPVSPLP
ncbi:MAG TPA: hypothetical protein VH481_01715 [Nitrososphaeraceae archaeon]|jgi:hypothetical protein